MMKVIAFRAIAKMVIAFISIISYRFIEEIACFPDPLAYFGQIDNPEWGIVFVYKIFQ